MTLLVLRLAGSLQSWGGYRHQVNIGSSVPTQTLPSKSALNGLLGAALGPTDRGFGQARNLRGIGERYALHVRVDTTNPPAEDFQILSHLPSAAAAAADRAGRLGSASTKAFPNSRRAAGTFATSVARRDYLAHSEFVVAIDTDAETAQAWLTSLQDPVFMPYLGRRSCAPAFPFVLGLHPGSPANLFRALPRVPRAQHGETRKVILEAYHVTGGFERHIATAHPTTYTPPVADRAQQLAWAKENLSR